MASWLWKAIPFDVDQIFSTRWVGKCAGWLIWIAGILAVVQAVVQKLGPAALSLPADQRSPVQQIMAWIYPQMMWLFPATALTIAFAPIVKKKYDTVPAQKENIITLLQTIRPFVFEEHVLSEPAHQHRLTVFYTKRRGMLQIFARSSHATAKSRRRFACPMDTDGKGEGFAGATYRDQVVHGVAGLPDLHASPSAEDISKYAVQSFVTEEWLKENMPHGRCYASYPIQKRNKPWGVLVADSRDPNGIRPEWQPGIPDGRTNRRVDLMTLFMNAIIERGA